MLILFFVGKFFFCRRGLSSKNYNYIGLSSDYKNNSPIPWSLMQMVASKMDSACKGAKLIFALLCVPSGLGSVLSALGFYCVCFVRAQFQLRLFCMPWQSVCADTLFDLSVWKFWVRWYSWHGCDVFHCIKPLSRKSRAT